MKKIKAKKSAAQLLNGFLDRISGDHVSAYAAQAAYFLILSFIPFVLFLITMVGYTPLTYNVVRDAIGGFVPLNLQSYVLKIVADVYNSSTSMVPTTAIVALWSAGRGMQSITNGLNCIYHVKETRNWLVTRIYSVFYTVLFVVALIVSLILLVLGNRIQEMLAEYLPFVGKITVHVLNARTFLVFGVLFVVFMLIYKVLPNRKATLKSQMPGALLTASTWSVFSYAFSIYFELFPNFRNIYGNLTTVIMVMLWLYGCMNLVLYGAEVNAYFENEFRMARKNVKERIAREWEQRTASDKKEPKEQGNPEKAAEQNSGKNKTKNKKK